MCDLGRQSDLGIRMMNVAHARPRPRLGSSPPLVSAYIISHHRFTVYHLLYCIYL